MVEKPGTFPVTDVPVRVVSLGLAGGLQPDADLFDVTLSRDNARFNNPLFDICTRGG